MDYVRGILLIVALIAALTAYGMLRERHSRRRREAFTRNRVPYTDLELVGGLGLSTDRDRRVCCAIRSAVAKKLGVPPEMLHPNDDMYTLSFGLHYRVQVPEEAARDAIEHELGKPLDALYEALESFEGRGTGAAKNFREFLLFYLEHLDRLTQPKNNT
ncbi:MAG: hypothetical protein ACHRHE_17755 [Tepidisphaerales bacterium]